MSQEDGKFSWLKIISLLFLGALFIAEYGLNIMAKPVPSWVYFGLIGLVVGIEFKDLKVLILTVLENIASRK